MHLFSYIRQHNATSSQRARAKGHLLNITDWFFGRYHLKGLDLGFHKSELLRCENDGQGQGSRSNVKNLHFSNFVKKCPILFPHYRLIIYVWTRRNEAANAPCFTISKTPSTNRYVLSANKFYEITQNRTAISRKINLSASYKLYHVMLLPYSAHAWIQNG